MALGALEREISYGAPVLSDVLRRCSSGDTARFFAACAKDIESGLSAGEAWRRNDAALELSEHAERCLRSFANGLGKSDRTSQQALIRSTVDALKPELASAAEKSARLSRLYIWLGASGGAAAVIILL